MWPLVAHILHTSKRGSSKRESKFQVNAVKTFCKIGEKLTFQPILAVFGAEKGPEIWTREP